MAISGNNAAPSTDAQISAFKGVAVQDGEVTSANDGVAIADEAHSEDDSATISDAPRAPAAKRPSAEVQKRINEAVSRQRRAERAAEASQAELRAISERLARIEGAASAAPANLTGGRQAASSVDPNAPNPANYQYGELDARYVADLARHSATQVIETDRQQRAAETTRAARERDATELRAFADKGVEKFPDFYDVVIESANRKEWPLGEVVAKLSLASEFGHDLVYDLARDYNEAQRVNAMTPVEQARWFGRREAYYSARSPAANGNGQANGQRQAQPPTNGQTLPVRTTQAPPPPQSRIRGGGNPQPVSADTPDFGAFERMVMGDRQRR